VWYYSLIHKQNNNLLKTHHNLNSDPFIETIHLSTSSLTYWTAKLTVFRPLEMFRTLGLSHIPTFILYESFTFFSVLCLSSSFISFHNSWFIIYSFTSSGHQYLEFPTSLLLQLTLNNNKKITSSYLFLSDRRPPNPHPLIDRLRGYFVSEFILNSWLIMNCK
jgi:hypothetical protein